eukprot:s3560_g6.t3
MAGPGEFAVVADGYWCATLGPLLLLKPPQLTPLLRPIPPVAVRPLGFATTLWGTLLLNERVKDQVGHRRAVVLVCGANTLASAALAALTFHASARSFLGAITLQVAGFAAWQGCRSKRLCLFVAGTSAAVHLRAALLPSSASFRHGRPARPVLPTPARELSGGVSYQLAASWLNWELAEMVQDPILPALYYFDVEPQHGADCYRYTDGDLEYGYEFQIVQDADWNQVIHPQNEQSDVSYEAVGPDSAGPRECERQPWDPSGCEAVLCSLAALRQWGPRPSAEVLGLGVAACAAYADANHQHGRKVWQQAMLLLDQMWAAECPGVSPSQQDYARLAQLCRDAGKEQAAKQLESEVAYWGCEDVNFQIVPGFIWNRQVRMLGGMMQNCLSWTLGAAIPTAQHSAWLLPCTDRAAREIAERKHAWEEAGWRTLTCDPDLVEALDDKVKLFEHAQRLGLGSFLPQRYTTAEAATYPCMLKPASGQYGEGARIVNNSADVQCVVGLDVGTDWVLQEMIQGHYEYSTSLLVWHGNVLDAITMKYHYDGTLYVWPRVREISKEMCDTPAEHLAIMTKFLTGYSGICNFNYKRRPDGRPCIFEVNPRIGVDLAGDAPKPRARPPQPPKGAGKAQDLGLIVNEVLKPFEFLHGAKAYMGGPMAPGMPVPGMGPPMDMAMAMGPPAMGPMALGADVGMGIAAPGMPMGKGDPMIMGKGGKGAKGFSANAQPDVQQVLGAYIGQIKSFNATHGFGFIVCEGLQQQGFMQDAGMLSVGPAHPTSSMWDVIGLVFCSCFTQRESCSSASGHIDVLPYRLLASMACYAVLFFAGIPS